MKKILTIISAFILLTDSNSVQAQAYKEKQSDVTIGYGFPNIYKSILKSAVSNNGNYTAENRTEVKGYGPLFLKYEYGLTKLIGLGASIGYWNTKYTETSDYVSSEYNSSTGTYSTNAYRDVFTYKISSLSIGARLNFHFATQEKLDPYAGIAAGYTQTLYKFSFTSNNPDAGQSPAYEYSGIPVYFAITAGLRYYFTENIGIYGELGLDKWSVIQGGLAIKF